METQARYPFFRILFTFVKSHPCTHRLCIICNELVVIPACLHPLYFDPPFVPNQSIMLLSLVHCTCILNKHLLPVCSSDRSGTPSHPIPSHPIPSHPIPSHPITSHHIPPCAPCITCCDLLLLKCSEEMCNICIWNHVFISHF